MHPTSRQGGVRRTVASRVPLLAAVLLLLASVLATPAVADPADRPDNVAQTGGDTTVDLTWDAVAGATSYQVIHRSYAPIHTAESEAVIEIVGGSQVEIDDFPWQVAVLDAGNANGFQAQFCGGTLIHPQWVLTAGHCLFDEFGLPLSADDIHIAAGETALAKIATTDRSPVDTLILHPDFDFSTLDNDIALMRLAVPTERGEPIRMAKAKPPLGTEGMVSGWGSVAFDGAFPNKLRAVDVVDLAGPNGVCGHYSPFVYDSSTMLCAGQPPGGKDACQGDSGGPLVMDLGGQYLLTGVVSKGFQCAEPNFPGIYTRVSAFFDWVAGEVPEVDWRTRTAPGTATQLTGLTNGVLYEVLVAGVDAQGRGPYSSRVIGRPFTTPLRVRKLRATPGNGSIALTWREPLFDNGANIRDYRIIFRENSGPWQLFIDGKSTATNATIDGLTNGSTYDVAVAARNAAGRSRYRVVAGINPS